MEWDVGTDILPNIVEVFQVDRLVTTNPLVHETSLVGIQEVQDLGIRKHCRLRVEDLFTCQITVLGKNIAAPPPCRLRVGELPSSCWSEVTRTRPMQNM